MSTDAVLNTQDTDGAAKGKADPDVRDAFLVSEIMVSATILRDLADWALEDGSEPKAELGEHALNAARLIHSRCTEWQASDAEGAFVESGGFFGEIERVALGLFSTASRAQLDERARDIGSMKLARQIAQLATLIQRAARDCLGERGATGPRLARGPDVPLHSGEVCGTSIALAAYDAASLAREQMGHFAALFDAIGRQVSEHSNPARLAQIGSYLAETHQNTLDCDCERLDNELKRATFYRASKAHAGHHHAVAADAP